MFFHSHQTLISSISTRPDLKNVYLQMTCSNSQFHPHAEILDKRTVRLTKKTFFYCVNTISSRRRRLFDLFTGEVTIWRWWWRRRNGRVKIDTGTRRSWWRWSRRTGIFCSNDGSEQRKRHCRYVCNIVVICRKKMLFGRRMTMIVMVMMVMVMRLLRKVRIMEIRRRKRRQRCTRR